MSDLPLLRADPHRWGRGAIHLIDEEKDQTRCGKSPGACPGTKFWGGTREITCRICLSSLDAERRRVRLQAEIHERERQWEEDRREWWRLYDAYLRSPTWQAKRQRVLQRAGGFCEGCGERHAVQVHHRHYPKDCWPGTAEWVAQEKLFDLTAICLRCHNDVHRRAA